MKNSIDIKTFGCKLNHYDSTLIKKNVQALSAQPVVILNTCAVTQQAGKDIRKQAQKIKQLKPDSLLVVTGCGAQVETQLYEQTKAVDLIVGNSDRQNLKLIIENFLKDRQKKVFKTNIFKTKGIYSDFLAPSTDRTRAFLKIQEGCDSFCTFCIIPFARGKSKSLPISFLIDSIHKLERQNVQEVVLTGVHIGDYEDQGQGLEALVEALLQKTKIPRIRLSSLEPTEITSRLLDCYQNERICPHFHISLQSVSSKVLKSMKRSYSQKEVEQAFEQIAKKVSQAFVGMDIIAGFPTESDQDFTETLQVLKAHSWTNMHVFPYSPRKGTYSFFKYEALDQKKVTSRASQLRQLSTDRFQKKIKQQVGSSKKVLLFKTNNSKGLSRDYWKVKLPPSDFQGEKTVKIDSFNGPNLLAHWD